MFFLAGKYYMNISIYLNINMHPTSDAKILIKGYYRCLLGFPGGTSGKDLPCQCRRHKRHGFSPWVEEIPWRRAW